MPGQRSKVLSLDFLKPLQQRAHLDSTTLLEIRSALYHTSSGPYAGRTLHLILPRSQEGMEIQDFWKIHSCIQ